MAANIPVWDTIVESWEKTYGVKGSFWAAFGIMIAIAIGFGFIEGLIPAIAVIISLISSAIAFLLRAGTIYMGILRARNAPVNYQQVFRAMRFDLGLKVVIVYALQVLISLPFVALIAIAGILMAMNTFIGVIVGIVAIAALIYVSVRISFGMCYVVDKEIGAWDAIKLSFNVTRDHVWSLIGIFLLFFCILIISAIPLGIGLIWTLPCSFVLYGVLYQKLISHQ